MMVSSTQLINCRQKLCGASSCAIALVQPAAVSLQVNQCLQLDARPSLNAVHKLQQTKPYIMSGISMQALVITIGWSQRACRPLSCESFNSRLQVT